MRALLSVLALLIGAGPVRAADRSVAPFSLATIGPPPAPWRVVGVPGGKIPFTDFSIAEVDGRPSLRVATAQSYANLVHNLPPASRADGLRLQWRWRLDEPLLAADLSTRQGDDSPLKVCLLFDMPLDKLGLIERNLFRLARAASAEHLPAATLCYVWDHKLPPQTLLNNAYTARVRNIVVSSGAQALGTWVAHSRDVAADFLRAFGAESEVLPPLQAVLVGADSDNTQGSSLGYVGDIRLEPCVQPCKQ